MHKPEAFTSKQDLAKSNDMNKVLRIKTAFSEMFST